MSLKKITYKSMPWKRLLLLQAGVILMPIVGFVLWNWAYFYMFLACLIAYVGQLILWYLSFCPTQEKTIPVKEAQKEGRTERRKYLITIPIGFTAIYLNLFPLMAESQMDFTFHQNPIIRDYDPNKFVFLIILIMFIGLFMCIIGLLIGKGEYEFPKLFDAYKNDKTVHMTRREIKEMNRKRQEKILQQKQQKIALYGEGYQMISKELNIYVNEQTKMFFVGKRKFAFHDILNYRIDDKVYTTEYTTDTQVRSNNGSVIGRAIVGNALFGKTGAIIGAATASQTIIPGETYTEEHHSYSITIFVNDMNQSMTTINVNTDTKLLNKIVSVLTIITNRR